MNITSLTPQQLRKAADIQEKIDVLRKQLADILGGEAPAPSLSSSVPAAPKTGGRKISAAGRAAISAAAKARWAKHRVAKGQTQKKPKTQRSAAWRSALAAAAKIRWAKAKAAGRTKL
jgi:hypothetical protein